MRYRIACSDEEGRYFYYCKTEEEANLLFNVLVLNRAFAGVELERVTEEYSAIREWSEDDEKSAV